jgi:hypothetical protein
MSTILAILLSFALIVLALAPLVVAYRFPTARVPVALLYAVLLMGLAVYHTGLSFDRIRPPTAAAAGPGTVSQEGDEELTERCAEALEMAEEGSLIRDKSDPQRLVVDRALWAQVPDFVKETLVLCIERSRPAGQSDAAIEIIEE